MRVPLCLCCAVERNPWCEVAETKDRIVELLKEKTVEGEEGIVIKNSLSKWTVGRKGGAATVHREAAPR